jgi:hypothetical protein
MRREYNLAVSDRGKTVELEGKNSNPKKTI